jgi:acyl carrier protein
MSTEQIEASVTGLLAKTLDRETGAFDRTTHLYDELLMDSLDSVELVMALEDEHRITIPDEDADRWRTVGDVIDYIAGVTAANDDPRRQCIDCGDLAHPCWGPNGEGPWCPRCYSSERAKNGRDYRDVPED